ncbi:Uncharacterized protein Adt_11185 [Abeliophyllum distichum]|uniref:Retrotransposon gag domain-containing protein n=1 Tax=Abeliophyllum distichum TaxID=126358 RepID=A0ABD1UMF9_9LAMI
MSETRSKAQEEHLKKIDREMGELSAAYRTVINKVESFDLTLKVLGNRQEKIENIVSDINQKYETLVAMMAQISGNMKEGKDKQAESSAPQTRSGNFGSNRMGTPQINQAKDDNGNHTKMPKFDFPYFNGEGPREWVRKVRKYFQLHQVAEGMKVDIAEMYLKGKADIWFHGFAASHPDAEWNVFAEEICRRFSDTTGEEVVETFSKDSLGVLLNTRRNLRN